MSEQNILSRLAAGERLLLDGATGSELQKRGVNVSQGVTDAGNLGTWSATAMGDAPEIVRQVHEDYLRVGVDIITTNSFWTNRPRLAMVGLADRMEAYTRLSAELACDARDTINPAAYVAGGIAPPGRGDLHREFTDQSTILAEAGVDLMLVEYVGSVADCVTAVDAVAHTGLPVFLGIRHVTEEGKMQFGETVEQLAKALEGHPVDSILVMCSDPKAISATLPRLREAFTGPIGAYANIGYERPPEGVKTPDKQWHLIDIGEYTPERYAEYVQSWLEMGAQILGGCCATTPAHIEAIRPLVKG